MDSVKSIKEVGNRAKGRTERIKCLQGKRLTRDKAILAHCYDCTGGYADGNSDCGIETCSLHPYHPYRGIK